MLKKEDQSLNLNIFELDSEKRHSDSFTIFLFDAEEVDRLREYVNDFFEQYPILETIDKLLLALYKFKINLLLKNLSQEQTIKHFVQEVKNYQQELDSLSLNSLEGKILASALSYTLKSAQHTFDSNKKFISKACLNQWTNDKFS